MFELFKKTPKKEPETPISNIATLVREGDNLLSDSLILLDERLSGNLICAEEIVVEQNGVLSGNITAKRCVVSGTINGDIVSTHQMDIKSTAVIRGNIKSAVINIEPGAVINGKVIIAEDNRAAANLMERINNHSADEYLSAKLAAEQVDVPADEVKSFAKPFSIEQPAKKATINHFQDKPVSIKHEEPHKIHPLVQPKPLLAATPKVEEMQANVKSEEPPVAPIQQKPLVAPVPKVEEKPADEGVNQRWW